MKKWKCTVCGYIHEGKQPPENCPVCGTPNYRFILFDHLPEQVEADLKFALGAEAKAQVRNQAFAEKAEAEGYDGVARLFRAVAEAERVHASEYLKYFENLIGTTEENLQTAFENEIKAHNEGYAPLIRNALEAKREDVAWSFSRSRDVEARHAKLYKEALTAMVVDREVDYHVCQVCGYVFDAAPPDVCPVCKAVRSSFRHVP
jgi:rubrerythrin